MSNIKRKIQIKTQKLNPWTVLRFFFIKHVRPNPNPRWKMRPDPIRHSMGVEFLPSKPLNAPKK